jgi:hypothetical protein
MSAMKDRSNPQSSKVSERYPAIAEISCKACRLECNVCQHRDLSLFATCNLLPEGCALKHNIAFLTKAE